MSNIYILSLYYHFILSSWPPSEFKSRRHRSDGTQPGPGAKPQQKREEHFGSLVQALMFSVPGVFKPLTLAFPWEFLITLKNIELITILDYKVVPQFVSVQLVYITLISLWFMVDISNYLLWFINQRSHPWGGTTLWIWWRIGW